MSPTAPADRFAELLQYIEGELTVVQAQKLEAELAGSAALRDEHARVKRLITELSAGDSELNGVDLVPDLHRLMASPPAQRQSRVRRTWVAAGVAVAAAAGIVFVVVSAKPITPAEFQVRGTGDDAAKWVGLEVFQADHSPVGDVVRRQQGLAFAYRNTGQNPFGYLMIFARDARGRVFWFYPEWTDVGTDPASIPIGASDSAVQMRELIAHDFEPGQLTLHALFTRRPLRVSEVEARLSASGSEEIKQPDAVDRRRVLRVEP